jgi:Transcriptional regulators of sugar metabolism
MLSIASDAFIVADSSKFHRKALFRMFPLERFSTIITDKFLNPIRASQLPVPVIRANGS